MASFGRKEEEEHPFANFDFDSVKLAEEENPFKEFDFQAAGFGGDSDSLGFSFDRAMRAGGRGLSELLPRMGLNVPQGIQDYSAKLQEAGEAGMKDYVPEYQGEITQQSLKDVPGFLGEKLAENATAMGITMFGLTLGQSLMKGPGVSKLIGAGVTGAAAGFNYLMLLDEAVETHASAAGKTVDELSESEIGNSSWTAIQNSGLDFILPGLWARSLKKAGLPAKKSLKDLAKNLTTTEKDKIGSMLYKGARQTLKSSLIEGGIESAQQANMMRTSVLGTAGINPESMLTDFAVGFAGGGLYGSPVAVSEATSVNRSRRADKMILDFADVQAKIKAGEKYSKDVKSYEKDFDKLVSEYDELAKDIKKGKKIDKKTFEKFAALPGTGKPFNVEAMAGTLKRPKFDLDKNVADIVIPGLFNIPDESKGTLAKTKDAIFDLAYKKSVDGLKDMLKGVKTGKDMQAYNDIIQPLADVETSSGETQEVSRAFETVKSKLVGKYVNKFEVIRNKWTKHFALMGEMGSNVRPSVNMYIAAKLEEKNQKPLYNLAQAEAQVLSEIGAVKKADLDNDIRKLAALQEKIYGELHKALGADGLTIGHQKGYLTRSIWKKAVQKNPDAFINSLVRDVGLEQADAQIILDNVLNDVDPNIFTSDQIRKGLQRRTGLGPASFERIRKGNWDKLDLSFRNPDTLQSIEAYLLSAVTRVASAQSFGADGANKYNKAITHLKDRGILTDAGTEKLWGIYDAYHHVYKKPRTENQRALAKAMKGVSTVTAVTYLGLATISSWTEPLWTPQRTGWYNTLRAAPTIAGYALKGLARSIYGGREGKEAMSSFGRDLIRVMGFATNPALSERVEMLFAGDRNVVMNYFFRTPAALWLTQYTNFVRVWTATAGLHMIQGQYNKIDSLGKNGKRLLIQELSENGMTLEDFRKMGGLANGKLSEAILSDEYLDSTFTNSKGNVISVRDVLVPWLRKITTDVALHPHAGNRPLWMSDPNMMLVAQLKSFPILFGNTIARRLNHKMNPKFCSTDFVGKLGTISAISGAIGMAALAMAVKDAIRGVEKERSPIEIVSAIGVPLIGEFEKAQIGGYVVGPWASLTDKYIQNALGEDGLGKTAEEVYDLMLRATVGRIGSEALLGGDE